MIFHKFWSILNNQEGFTLIEVIAVVVITGLIGSGVAMATMQVVDQGSRNSGYAAASRHTLNAVQWISRDTQMSQAVEPDGASGFPLTLGWTEWDNSEHEIIYSLEEDKLKRSYSIDCGTPSEIVVAQYINSVSENTTCEFTSGILTLQVTTTVGEGRHALSVTKVREIIPRPGL